MDLKQLADCLYNSTNSVIRSIDVTNNTHTDATEQSGEFSVGETDVTNATNPSVSVNIPLKMFERPSSSSSCSVDKFSQLTEECSPPSGISGKLSVLSDALSCISSAFSTVTGKSGSLSITSPDYVDPGEPTSVSGLSDEKNGCASLSSDIRELVPRTHLTLGSNSSLASVKQFTNNASKKIADFASFTKEARPRASFQKKRSYKYSFKENSPKK